MCEHETLLTQIAASAKLDLILPDIIGSNGHRWAGRLGLFSLVVPGAGAEPAHPGEFLAKMP